MDFDTEEIDKATAHKAEKRLKRKPSATRSQPKAHASTIAALEKRPYVIGCDPGLDGALTVLDPLENRIVDVIDVPTFGVKTSSSYKTSGIDRHVDVHSLAMSLDVYGPLTAFSVIERVGAMPEQGLASTFKFGLVTGQIWGILASLYVPVFPVRPQAWKLALGLDSDKMKSVKMAREQWPTYKNNFRLKKHNDRAESALMAFWAFRNIRF